MDEKTGTGNRDRNGKKRGREKRIFPATGKIGNGKNNFFPEPEGERPFFRSRQCLGATLTGHHVSPCEERVLC